MKKEQKLPEWFEAEVYKEGKTVENRFTGEEYELNNIELSIYDFTIGASLMSEMGINSPDIIKDIKRGLDWFRENNNEAYKTLLE
jgi:hypothetical protein